MSALSPAMKGSAHPRMSPSIVHILDDVTRWIFFIAVYGVICAGIVGLVYLASRTGSLFEH